MGFELNRLMQQYGVGTAAMAPYGGAPDPGTAPVAPTAPTAPEALRDRPVRESGMPRIEFRADMQDWRGDKQQYKQDMKAYNAAVMQFPALTEQYEKDKAAFDEALRKYNVDKPVYDTYTAAYQNRIMNTPMYNSPQFMVGNQTYTPTWSDQLASPEYTYPAASNPLPGTQQAAGPKFFTTTGSGRNLTYEPFQPTGPVDMAQYEWDPIRGAYVKKRPMIMGMGTPYAQNYSTGGKVEDLAAKYEADDELGQLIKERVLQSLASKEQPEVSPDAMLASEFASQEDPIGDYLDAYYNARADKGLSRYGFSPFVSDIQDTEPEELVVPQKLDYDAIMAAVPEAPADYRTLGDALPLRVAPPAGEPVIIDRSAEVLPMAEPPASVADLVRRYGEGDTSVLDQIELPVLPYQRPPNEMLIIKPASGPAAIDLVSPTDVQPPIDLVEPTSTQTSVAPAATTEEPKSLEQLDSEYKNLSGKVGRGSYHDELAMARAAAKAEQVAFEKMVKDMMASPEDAEDSKAELYFRLAAAFGSPTKTGHFAENLGLAGKEMTEYTKGKRASAADRRKLAFELQKMKAAAAKDEYTTLRQLAAEEMRDERAIQASLLKEYIASGKAQSAAGKQAVDEGYAPGTPEFKKRVGEIADLNIQKQAMAIQAAMAGVAVSQGNLALSQEKFKAQQGKLSPTEVKMKAEAEDNLVALKQSLADIKEAYRLNPNSLGGSWAEKGQQWLYESAGSKDPKIVNTRIINNLLGSQALEKLREKFGGSPTEGERTVLLELEGIGSKTLEERAAIMKRAYKVLKARIAKQEKRLQDIGSGAYSKSAPDEADSIEGE